MEFIKYFIPSIYLALVIIHGWYHSYLIREKNKLIKSRQKTFEWGIASVICFFSLLPVSNWLPLIVFPIVTRLAFFAPALNLFRGKKIFYRGVISKQKSLWDYVESRLPISTATIQIIYLAMYIVYLLSYFNVI